MFDFAVNLVSCVCAFLHSNWQTTKTNARVRVSKDEKHFFTALTWKNRPTMNYNSSMELKLATKRKFSRFKPCTKASTALLWFRPHRGKYKFSERHTTTVLKRKSFIFITVLLQILSGNDYLYCPSFSFLITHNFRCSFFLHSSSLLATKMPSLQFLSFMNLPWLKSIERYMVKKLLVFVSKMLLNLESEATWLNFFCRNPFSF